MLPTRPRVCSGAPAPGQAGGHPGVNGRGPTSPSPRLNHRHVMRRSLNYIAIISMWALEGSVRGCVMLCVFCMDICCRPLSAPAHQSALGRHCLWLIPQSIRLNTGYWVVTSQDLVKGQE